MSQHRNGALLVVQSGGPTPVINATLVAIIEEAQSSNAFSAIYGLQQGLAGGLEGQFVNLASLSEKELRHLAQTPSCALGTSRRRLQTADYEQLLETFRSNNIRAFVVIGGNGSMAACSQIAELAEEARFQLQILGVPKTVDNDIRGTDHTPGYGSAARFMAMSVRDAGLDLEAMRTFEDVVIVESMGRDAGWLAASAGLGRESEKQAPHLIYLPEAPFDETAFLDDVAAWHRRLGAILVVASESLRDKNGEFVGHDTDDVPQDEMGRTLYGFAQGTGSYLSKLVMKRLGLRARFMRPGPLGRVMSCCVSEVDRSEAFLVGKRAVTALLNGVTGKMVTLERRSAAPYECETGLAPLAEVAGGERLLPERYYDVSRRAVTSEFKGYALPLISGPLPPITRLPL